MKVLIADDEAPARARLRRLLEDCRADLPNQVVGEAGLAHEALAAPALTLADAGKDVVLVDVVDYNRSDLPMTRYDPRGALPLPFRLSLRPVLFQGQGNEAVFAPFVVPGLECRAFHPFL